MNFKNLVDLELLELPLTRCDKHRVGIKENDLEKYLIDNNYNIYNKELITYNDVAENDLIVDSTLICDIMNDLGFSVKILDNDLLLFFIEDENESRYIEIIQEVCEAKKGLNYSISDSEDGELFSNIYVYDSKNNDKEYNIIYSFENDDYVIKREKAKIKLTYTDEMKAQDLLWETEDEDCELMRNLFNQIIVEARGYGCTNYFIIYQGPEECICDVYESEEEFDSWDDNEPVEFSFGCCSGLINCIETLMNK